MDRLTLQLQGSRDAGLLAAVLGAVVAVLAVQAIAHLVRGRKHRGLLCLVAGLPGGAVLLVAAGAAAPLPSGAWMAALGAQVALAVAVFYSAVYAYLGRRKIGALMALRLAAIATLLLVLFKPVLGVVPGAADLRPRLAVLVDRSQSMGVADQAGGATRYAQCLRMIQGQDDRLRSALRPTYYHFAVAPRTAESLEDLARLQPAGEGTDATDIAAALRAADADRADLAGILLFSDGLHNAASDLPKALAETGVPVYAVGVGSGAEDPRSRRSVQIVSLEAPFDAIRDNVTTIRAAVKGALPADAADVQLLEGGAVVATGRPVGPSGPAGPLPTPPARTSASGPGATSLVELRWTPAAGAPASAPAGSARPADVRRLTLRVAGGAGPAATEAPAPGLETEVHILVTDPKIRVLYVEGTLRPEYKFLSRTLGSDPQVQRIGLVRTHGNEFTATGDIDGRSLSGLPRTEEDFRLFDVIILGDLDATFLDAARMGRLRKFVADGGGLLMLGGHNSFGPGGYGGTDVEAVLPVLVGPRSQAQETAPFLPLLTADGTRHPIFDGLADWFPTPGGPPRRTDGNLPALAGCVTVVASKPGASVLAVHPARPDQIVLAVQPFGAGRSAAFTADTTWQWFLAMQAHGEESPYRLFWGQFVRWLANVQAKGRSAAGSLVLRADPPVVKAGSDVKLTARVLDDRGKPAATAVVHCVIEPQAGPGGSSLRGEGALGGGPSGLPSPASGASPAGPLPAPPAESVPLVFQPSTGLFEGTYRAAREGRFVLRASARGGPAELAADPVAQRPLAGDELALTIWPQTTELDALARDEAALRRIAERTGGRYADLAGLPEIIDQVLDRQRTLAAPAPKAVTHALYNFPLLLVLFVALLTGEWLLRRNWQLQ